MKKIGSLINYAAPFLLILIDVLRKKGMVSSKTHIGLAVTIALITIFCFIMSVVLELKSKSENRNKKLIIYSIMLAFVFLIILFSIF